MFAATPTTPFERSLRSSPFSSKAMTPRPTSPWDVSTAMTARTRTPASSRGPTRQPSPQRMPVGGDFDGTANEAISGPRYSDDAAAKEIVSDSPDCGVRTARCTSPHYMQPTVSSRYKQKPTLPESQDSMKRRNSFRQLGRTSIGGTSSQVTDTEDSKTTEDVSVTTSQGGTFVNEVVNNMNQPDQRKMPNSQSSWMQTARKRGGTLKIFICCVAPPPAVYD